MFLLWKSLMFLPNLFKLLGPIRVIYSGLNFSWKLKNRCQNFWNPTRREIIWENFYPINNETTIDVISDRRVLESFPPFFTFLLGIIHIPYFAMHLEARHSFWVHVWMGNGKNVNSGNFSPLKNARSGDLIYRKARRHGQRLKRLLDLRLIYRRIWRDRFSLLWKIGATSLTKFYVLQFHHFVSP